MSRSSEHIYSFILDFWFSNCVNKNKNLKQLFCEILTNEQSVWQFCPLSLIMLNSNRMTQLSRFRYKRVFVGIHS